MNLINIFQEVKDNRKKSGKRYPLHAILLVILLARLCGCIDCKAVWYFMKDLHWKQLHKLGFRKFYSPSYPIFLNVLKNVDISSLEDKLSDLVSSNVSDHLCMDGKTLCGSKTYENRAYHLLSLFCEKVEGVYGQIKSATGGGEIAAAMSLLSSLDIEGKLITGDALFCTSRLCKKIDERGGYYQFKLKSNRQDLFAEAVQVFQKNPWPEMVRIYKEPIDKNHGRIEYREIEVMNWPYIHRECGFKTINQVMRITRYREDVKTGKITKTISYAVTNMIESKATPKMLLQYDRGHWATENKLHRTRDVLFCEDKQTLSKGDAPEASAALSNLAIWLIKKNKGKDKFKNMSMKAITQACARNVNLALSMI